MIDDGKAARSEGINVIEACNRIKINTYTTVLSDSALFCQLPARKDKNGGNIITSSKGPTPQFEVRK